MNIIQQETICALSTPSAMSAVAIVRISGNKSLAIIQSIFVPKYFCDYTPRKVYYGNIKDGENILDEVLLTYFAAPHSFTGEDVIEVACHGSLYVQKRLIELLLAQGACLAKAGEFTQRAFLNGKMDLSQAESVADLIAAQSRSAHQLAVKGLKGEVSQTIKVLRDKLIHFAAMLELELDFAEEDVEFADRDMLNRLIIDIDLEINTLLNSFVQGNAIKNGIAVAIVGKPNVGKSTLLNLLLKEERAIVSDIPGTTRDTIEDVIVLNGFTFRFIDTAGLHKSEDIVENMGIERTIQTIDKADIVLWVIDARQVQNYQEEYLQLFANLDLTQKKVIIIANKIDLVENINLDNNIIFISAVEKKHIDEIENKLVEFAQNYENINTTLISNLRHYNALQKAKEALHSAKQGLSAQLSNDCVAVDIRQVLFHLGEIVGEVSNENILGEIFSRFCIGK